MKFEVSVIIPTYNRADLIIASLESVFTQTHPAAEVIVVDDGSKDETETVVRRRFPAVRYVQIKNSGDCGARNAGVAVARAPWLAFLDSDDLWRPEKLALHARLCASQPDIHFSFSNFATIVDDQWSAVSKLDGAPPDFFGVNAQQVAVGLLRCNESLYSRLFKFQPIFPSTMVISQDYFHQAGGWNAPLGRIPSADLEFILRCVKDPPTGVVTAPVAGIRKHASNFSRSALRTTMGEIQILRYVLQNHPPAQMCREIIEREIIRRSAAAAELAFEQQDIQTVRMLLKAVPSGLRPRRLRAKAAIVGLPIPAAKYACRAAVSLARHARHL
jgi:glycosyltransferase involved in cell wall biosynthesis